MSDQNPNETTVEDKYLGMSDEDFANLDPNEFEQEVVEESGEDDNDDLGMVDDAESDTGSEEATTEDGDGTEEGADTDADESAEGDTDDAETSDEASDDDEAGEADSEDGGDEESDTDEDENTDDEKTEDKVDYEAEYKKLLAPFRANGKDMTVENIEDARQLMQMGANYNKKMAALKPSLKTLKLLENNSLMDESKLSYLIDLHKGDKGAIQKLIKDSGIDPLDMDVEADSDYEPKTYTVDERELALDEVLERIQDTPTYSETVNVVSNKWDKASKQMVADQPDILEAINSHMASGIYERVNAEVEKERTMGRLNGLTDLEAYRQVGDSLHAKGAFNDLVQSKQDTPPAEKPKQKVTPKAKPENPKLKSKKRAASSTNAKPAAAEAADLNPLGMSDEAFEQQYNSKLL